MNETKIYICNPMEGMRSPKPSAREAHPFCCQSKGEGVGEDFLRDIWDSSQDRSCAFFRLNEIVFLQIHLPSKTEPNHLDDLFIYGTPEELFLWSETEKIRKFLEDFLGKGVADRENGSFLGKLLLQLISDDLLHLQGLEKQADQIEENVLSGYCPDFNRQLLPMKKELGRYNRCYNQLLNLVQELLVDENRRLLHMTSREVKRFQNKIAFLAQETQAIREYVMQVQDVYQSEIEIRQNDVMKVLTSVTTIFLPLTLIAGWYGMNFRYMPELTSEYGYPLVFVVSVAIVIFCIILFKRKKFW